MTAKTFPVDPNSVNNGEISAETTKRSMNATKIAPFLGPKATVEANVDSDSDGSDTVSFGHRIPSFNLHQSPLSTKTSLTS